ncbi:MAG: response regulator transcription factor [Marinifilaceae bacterium]|jgi:DNA-binding response OmpR family regulator
MKILIVEDNRELSETTANYLRDEGFICERVFTYQEASEKVHLYAYDVVVLDLGLPDGNGMNIIREMKGQRSEAGILIVSAKNSLDDKLEGLELGADDYITKPFHLAELNARVRSLIRRKKFDGNNCIQVGDLWVDTLSSRVMIGKQELNLTRKEYELLLYFLYNRNRVLTKENIAEHLWEDQIDLADNFDFIYTHIKNLRKKMIQAGGEDQIKSVYGMGYKFVG